MKFLWKILGRDRHGRLVRPWALLGPIVVLVLTLPLLRPLRHPDPLGISDEELARLATVQAIVEHKTLAIDGTDFAGTRLWVRREGRTYSDQPPVMSALLAPSYWVMRHAGIDFAKRPDLAMYLLTVLGVTLPVALSSGLMYRMGRLFELRRPWRATLGLVAVLASGLVSYATVLNPHAPAAAFVLCSAACLIHVSITNKRAHGSVWLILSGLCAALAATIDPPAVVFLALLPAVIFALRWTVPQRFGGLAVYLLGAALPLAMHGALSSNVPGHGFRVTGPAGNDSLFSFLRPGVATPVGATPDAIAYEDDEPRGVWDRLLLGGRRVVAALVGGHGLLSHFPVVVLGILGVTMVMHRHWPWTTKVLASVTLAGAVLLLILFTFRRSDWHGAMFATRWFIVFVPLVVFWAGAWLRRRHGKVAWTFAGALLAFSLVASVVGATGPLPREGFIAKDGSERYTVAGALRNLMDPPRPATDADEGLMAGG
jgi:4-amino-4-deoxy-L-arabinose transferase-like glycosyltransferase